MTLPNPPTKLHSVHQIDYLPPVFRRFLAAGPRDPEECWEWNGQCSPHDGYGQVNYRCRGKQTRTSAHRLAYVALVADIEPGLTLDHLCRNRACANPRHLEPVSAQVNLQRGVPWRGPRPRTPARSHCPAGHPLVDGNLIAAKLRSGQRSCLTCNRERSAARGALIRDAHTALGLTYREYLARYGGSAITARRIIAEHQA